MSLSKPAIQPVSKSTLRNRMRHPRRRLADGREAVVYIETREKVLAGKRYMQPMGAKT